MVETLVKSADELDLISSDGLVKREKILDTEKVLWIKTTIAENNVGEWHHHNGYRSYSYVDSGPVKIDWRSKTVNSEFVSEGDFFHTPSQTPHRISNKTEDEVEIITVMIGSEGDFVFPATNNRAVNDDIIVKGSGELSNSVDTPGMNRQEAFDHVDVTAVHTHVPGESSSGWHHHGKKDVFAYIKSGNVVIEYGPGGNERVEGVAGDFLYIPASVVHREHGNQADGINHFVGEGKLVTNVGSPQTG
jgi:uncharacterized RmlC-like cupin family protein